MNPKHEWFKVSKASIYFLYTYLFTLLLISGGALFRSLYEFESSSAAMFHRALLVGLESSVMGAAIFYIRKLYKACINLDILHPQTEEDKIRAIGIFFYFFLRPFFAACFSIIGLLLLKSGIELLSESIALKKNFYYSAAIGSFVIGYSSGDFIDKLEEIGKSVVSKVKIL